MPPVSFIKMKQKKLFFVIYKLILLKYSRAFVDIIDFVRFYITKSTCYDKMLLQICKLLKMVVIIKILYDD